MQGISMIARCVELIPDSANTTKCMASSAVKCAYFGYAGKARRGTGGKRPNLELVLNSLSREAQTQNSPTYHSVATAPPQLMIPVLHGLRHNLMPLRS